MQIENIEGTAISVIRAIYGAVSRGNLQITSDDPVSCALWIGATQLLHDFMQTTGIDQAEIAMNKPNAPGEGSEPTIQDLQIEALRVRISDLQSEFNEIVDQLIGRGVIREYRP